MAISFQIPQDIEHELTAEAKEAYLINLCRQHKISHFQVGEALGLDRFETAALLKSHQLFDDPTHREIDAEVKSSREQLGSCRP